MKPTLLLMAGAATLALAACDRNGAPVFGPPKMKAVSQLNCPDRTGDLQRVSAAADGKTCTYTDNDGTEVVLQLVAVSGDNTDAALKPIEASLATLVPALDAKPAPVAADAAEAGDAKQAAKDAAATGATAASDAAVDAAAEAKDSSDSDYVDEDEERVDVDLPGLHVRTRGEKADIRVLGMTIHHDDVNDATHVRREPRSGVGRSLMVDANDNGAVVRMGNSNRSNIKQTVIYAMEAPGSQGHHVVGYVVRGPRTGPLVVATVKSKREKDDHEIGSNEGVFHDASRLVRKAMRG